MEQIKEVLNKGIEKVKALDKKQKIIFVIIIIIILGVIVFGISKSTQHKNYSEDYSSSQSTSKKLKLTDEMLREIKSKASGINSSTETAVLKVSLGVTYNSIEIVKQDLTDPYTYTVYVKAIGVNKADYMNYKINYIAEEDKSSSKGYSIEKKYDLH